MAKEKHNQKQTDPSIENVAFNLKRECIYCGELLPEHYSKKRIYCKEVRDENGKLKKDCKGSYNRMIDQSELEVHREIIKEHKTVDDMIEAMVAKKGSIVSTADLNAYDIQLTSSLKYRISANGTLESDFLKYTIISNPNNQTHKIYSHE